LKIVLTFLIAFTIISCQQESDASNKSKSLLLNINHRNKFEISSTDDKCGEWGGDKKLLTIYRDDFKGPLLADYSEEIKNCDNIPESKISKSVKRIKLDEGDISLIIMTINELAENKINRESIPSHSGISNYILLSDSSMIIHDFPSIELNNFQKLIEKIN